MKWRNILIVLLICLLMGVVGAVDLNEGVTSASGTEVNLTNGAVTFADNTNGLSVATSTTIDNTTFIPAVTKTDNGNLTWTSGEKDWLVIDNPIVSMSYRYTGKSLKETIILKEDKQLSFPINLDNDSKIIPWDHGQWKIVSATSGNTMVGIIAEKPFGIDAAGNHIDMEYTWDGSALNLDYNRTLQIFNSTLTDIKNETDVSGVTIPYYDYIPISYPLIIDPTWTDTGSPYTLTDGAYTVLMWNTTGTTTWTVPTGVSNVEYLVVAGGGSGGLNGGAGGGAGGFRNNTSYSVTSGNSLAVIVGAGGATKITNGVGNIGGNSTFDTIISNGGGGGGCAVSSAGGNGGSGGGATAGQTNHGYGNTPPASPSQGNDGGDADLGVGDARPTGGGGGAGAAGSHGYAATGAGAGGAGVSSSITGNLTYYAGGGGGGASAAWTGAIRGDGGIGGGGYGSVGANNAAPGTDGFGGGGGGCYDTGSGGAGGSGVVIIRYLTPTPPVSSFTPSNTITGTNTVTQLFNDTSSGSPTTWNWSYQGISGGNNTQTIWSTVQNTTGIFNAGNYSIKLNTTNANGYNLSTQVTWVNVTSITDPNPDSLLQYKVGSSNVQINNQTPYVGTAIARNISSNTTHVVVNFTWDTSHVSVNNIRINESSANIPGLSIDSSSVHNGYAIVNMSKTSGFTAPSNALFDFDITYTKYAEPGTVDVFSFNKTNSYYYDIGNSTWWNFNQANSANAIIGTWPNVNADFTANATSLYINNPVLFTDNSSGYPDAWNWSFGDGNYSVAQNPVYTYVTSGYKNVSLHAYMSENGTITNTTTKTDYINVVTPLFPIANFTYTPVTGIVPVTVNFTDTSINANSYYWEFGDGNTSTVQSPLFTYNIPGQYFVKHSASNSNGTSWFNSTYNYVYVFHTPAESSFTNGTTPLQGLAPLTVQFIDTSTSDPAYWLWHFGDSNNGTYWDTNVQNPIHTYTSTGTYDVTLYAQNDGGGHTMTYSAYVTVYPSPPVTSFTANQTTGATPLTVQFTDTSTNYPTLWNWTATNIAENNTPISFSTLQNPTFTFNYGNNSIKLNATNSLGSNISSQTTWVNVTTPAPVASFIPTSSNGNTPFTVQFTDTSTNYPTSWLWDFGDGNTTNSTVRNPVHTYWHYGQYDTHLNVTNPYGNSSTLGVYNNGVLVIDIAPVADFYAYPLVAYTNYPIQFTDNSTNNPTSWGWTFGDGTSLDGTNSTDQNPTHSYISPGLYTVFHYASNNWVGTINKINYINITATPPAPVASFTGTPTSGYMPLAVQFTDTSQNYPTTWNWSFGDSGTSTSQNPTHTYTTAGTYSIRLNVTNNWGNSSITMSNYVSVTVPPSPVLSFIGSPTSGDAPLTVQFTDTSTNSPTYWWWNFVGGGTPQSLLQNPSYTYTIPGVYSVTMYAQNLGGANTITKTSYITVTTPSPPITNFTYTPHSGFIPLTVHFTDTTTGSVASRLWQFGDGGTSTSQNPSHTFSTAGNYTVNLTSTNIIGSSSKIYYVNATTPQPPTASFTGTPTSGFTPLSVQFTDTSINSPSSWSWTFGDGSTSTLQNPSHTYSSYGVYTVILTATNSYGSDTKTSSNYITASATRGRADLILTYKYSVVLYVKDSSSGNLITNNASVVDDNGSVIRSASGIFSGTYAAGQHSFTVTANSYDTNYVTYFVNTNLTENIFMTKIVSSVSTTWYTPKTALFKIVDIYGNPLIGANVSARFNSTTLPYGVSDLISNYGMNVADANQALNGTLIMSGSTDNMGAVVFTMLSTLKYDIVITYGGHSNYYQVYPQEAEYQFRFITISTTTDNIWDDLYANGNTKVWAVEPDPANVTFFWSFQDMTDLTTQIDFYLKDVDLNTTVYTTSMYSPVAGSIYQLNYTVPNERGKNYMAWENYTRGVA
ncbi:MAG: PKD domain-containing protein [Patescibacteria group bacterium]|jgi:PKD repeat protein